jgi:Concanavalin A-like lectin/glucanases superfamily
MFHADKRISKFRTVMLVGALFCGLAASAAADRCANPQTQTFLAGQMDGFALPADPTSPSAELATLLGASRKEFDDPAVDRPVGHTFQNLPTGICGARLLLVVCAGDGNSRNDALALEFLNPTFMWNQFLSTLSNQDWSPGDCAEIALDLESLPGGLNNASPTNVLSALTDGDFDVYVQDDSTVDFIRLQVDFCPPTECAPPPTGLVAWYPLDEPAGPLARDVTTLHNGTHKNDPTPVAGKFASALSFDGVNDFVEIPDHPDLDVATGDFSIDFWIKTTQTTGIRALLEKRDLDGGGEERGYTVFLSSGRLALQLAEGGSGFCDAITGKGCTNYDSGANIANGAWHFVAITVDRDQSDGIRFYVDCQQVGVANPTLRQDSLDNTAPLLFAKHAFGGLFFAGALDEVEIFKRALSPGEVTQLCQGKCKSRIEQNWDWSLCSNLNSTTMMPQICNSSTEARSYGVQFAALPKGSAPGPCNINGPTQFALKNAQPVQVPPGSCTPLDLEVFRATGQGTGHSACFEIQAEDLQSGEVVKKRTSIYDGGGICCFPTNGPSNGVPPGTSVSVPFEVRNVSSQPRTFNFRFESMSSDPQTPLVALNGQAPGVPVAGSIEVPANTSREISVNAALTEFRPFEQQDLLLIDADTNIAGSAATLRSLAPGCTVDATSLCLNDGRFRVNVVWSNFVGAQGYGQAVPLTGDTGYFWFFSPDNVEVVIKVLDGRTINDRFWIFFGALSNVPYSVTVTDTSNGLSRSYINPSGIFASIGDTQGLPNLTPLPTGALTEVWSNETPFQASLGALDSERSALCAGGPETLCVQNGRFQVEVDWRTNTGTGRGQAANLTNETGYFWFFSPNNIELVLKVLDGRLINQHWWIFYGALSDVEYTVTVTDTTNNAVKVYRNVQGNLASVGDTFAFPQ